MGSRFHSVVIDSEDPATLARWWAEVLDWRVVYQSDDEVTVAADDDAEPALVFVPVPERKGVKNRLHVDLAPDDQAAEIDRLMALGARRVDVGQGDATWVVLAVEQSFGLRRSRRPKFCVLSAR